MSVHLDKSKATVRLEAGLGDVAKVLEQWNKIVLSGVRSEVADVASGLPLRGLLNDHVVRLSALSRELVVAIRSGWSHTHGGHGLLLSEGWLSLLVGPVASNSARSEPFTVHGAQSFFGFGAVVIRNKAVATRAASLHVPHDASFRDGSKGGERLSQDFIVDLVGKISDENVEVVGGVFLRSGV